MSSNIDFKRYVVNDITKLTNLRNKLGVKSWDTFAIFIDCSPSNIYDHVYSKQEEGGVPVYEKILQPWHLKLFTLLNYLHAKKEKDLIEAILTPISKPKKLPASLSGVDIGNFANDVGEPITTGADLKKLTSDISELFGITDPKAKRGPLKKGEKKPSIKESQPLTYFMSSVAGIAPRTFGSYVNAPNAKSKTMRGIVSKLYSIVSYLCEEGREDLVQMLVDIDESYMKDYGKKRERATPTVEDNS